METITQPLAPAPDEMPVASFQPADEDDDLAHDGGPAFVSEAEEDAFWRGVCHGIRCGDGSRGEEEAIVLRYRADGWTPERQANFLRVLAASGSVSAAATGAGMSRESAYRLRRRPEGRAFARAWAAALLIAREVLADEAMERALNGSVQPVFYHGEQIGERVRHDNRLLQAMLSRLDRMAGDRCAATLPDRLAVEKFEELVDAIASGADVGPMLDEADEFAREIAEDRAFDCQTDDALLSRFEEARNLRRIAEADPESIDISDLDTKDMDEWTDEQWERAHYSGLLDRLGFDGDGDCEEDAEHPDDAEGAQSGADSWPRGTLPDGENFSP